MQWPVGLLWLAVGCAHLTRRAPTRAETLVPPGCWGNFSGSWEHENNVGFRYEATDDGSVLKLTPHLVNADGTPNGDPGASDMLITMNRQAQGFVGGFQMIEDTQGKSCALLFQATITACAPDRLTMQVEQSYAVDPQCQRIDMGGMDVAEHVLIRVKR